jgi:hypothetical protein
MALRAAFAWFDRRDFEDTLSELDHHLGSHDRLRTANQFLHASSNSAFELAAIEDAKETLERVESAAVAKAAPYVVTPRDVLLPVCASILAAVLAFWIHVEGTPKTQTDGQPQLLAEAAGQPDKESKPSPNRQKTAVREERPERPQPKEAQPKSDREARDPKTNQQPSPVLKGVKEGKGKTQTGESAEAATSSGAGDARGSSSQQPQKSQSPGKPTEPKKKPEAKEKPTKPENQERKEEEDSGATTGRGAASGSNRSPAASPWPSKDQVTSEDEEALEEDEDVDDEFDNSEARGGVQPGLRDRKPPVNRDLTIGFGTAKNPDANGRGGPGDHKKSRGVASLVLGSPIPDHIKGRPNPGKTKITQERVQPETEDAQPFQGTSRPAREAPFGTLDKPDLLPWMRELVRSYYLAIRRSD